MFNTTNMLRLLSTTTIQTNTLSSSITSFLHLTSHATAVSYAIRGIFFALNLLCNAIMWYVSAMLRQKK